MNKLIQHSSNPENTDVVSVDYQVTNKQVSIQFKVLTPQVHVSDEFTKEGFANHGLWNFDVVEVFIQKRETSSPASELITGDYLEIQCSPMNQKFALLVKKPRIEVEPIEALGTQFSAIEIPGGFEVEFTIPITDIPGDGADVYTNFCVCLGASDKRCYYALNINTEGKADFHRPDLFINIGKI